MALKSRLFSGDSELEAAAVSDPAHIVLGSTGPHVGKIQLALLSLDGGRIARGELQGSVYGPSTAAAVLNFKGKRDIVNRSYQKQADNIVGKMTMAALDKEMQRLEGLPTLPPRIEPLSPAPRLVFRDPEFPARSLSGSRLGVNEPPVFIPGGPAFQIEIPVNGIGRFQVRGGIGAQVVCDDVVVPFVSGSSRVGLVFDPDDGVFEVVPVLRDPHILAVRGTLSGRTLIRARRGSVNSSSDVTLALVVKSNFSSSQFVSPFGTPINPTRRKRMINIFGELETEPGFENFTTDPRFRESVGVIREFTDDPKKPPGLENKSASDICLRNSPISNKTLEEMKRIAIPGCRLTITLSEGDGRDSPGSTTLQLKRVRDFFVPPGRVLQEGVMDGIKDPRGETRREKVPTTRSVLVRSSSGQKRECL